jgi:hypothetical protein
LSCKSAKIMLDPVTGVSRGYGFVRCAPFSIRDSSDPQFVHRFTDEPDQQRALIEMHGLYCLSRPSTPQFCSSYAYTHPSYYSSAHIPCHS